MEQGKPETGKQVVVARPTGWMWRFELAAVGWLAILGIASIIVGGHDAIVGTDINVRLLGSLLSVAGVMLLTGAWGLLHRKPVGLTLAMIAALLGVAIGVMTSLTQVVNDEPDGRLIAWITIVLVSAAVVVYVRQLTPPEERAKSIWSRLPILKSAVSLGLLFSVAQFWYSQIYVATTEPPVLTLKSTIDEVTRHKNDLVIRGSVEIENTSDTQVYVLASTLDIVAKKFASDRNPPARYRRNVRQADREQLESADRYLAEEAAPSVTHGRLLDEGEFLEAGEKLTKPVITWVPRGTYNAVYLYAWVTAGRGKSLGLADVEVTPEQLPDPKRLIFLTRLPEAGWLRHLTRGDRYVRVEYYRDPDNYPLVQFAPDRKPDPPEGFDSRLTDFYGVGAFESTAIATLP